MYTLSLTTMTTAVTQQPPEIDLTFRVADLIQSAVKFVDIEATVGRFSLVAYQPLGQPDPLMIVSHTPMRYDTVLACYFNHVHKWGKANWSIEGGHSGFDQRQWWLYGKRQIVEIATRMRADSRLTEAERQFVYHHLVTALAKPNLYGAQNGG